MIAVIQRVSEASVKIEGNTKASIQKGLLALIGIEDADGDEDISWLTTKIVNLRIFDDDQGVMNLSVKDIGGDIIVVSQFTLQASTKKGNRPSYLKASKPDVAIPLYQHFLKELEDVFGRPVQSGEFGKDMKVGLINDGPVTIVVDTQNRN